MSKTGAREASESAAGPGFVNRVEGNLFYVSLTAYLLLDIIPNSHSGFSQESTIFRRREVLKLCMK